MRDPISRADLEKAAEPLLIVHGGRLPGMVDRVSVTRAGIEAAAVAAQMQSIDKPFSWFGAIRAAFEAVGIKVEE
jgi:hypothetical protein